MKSKVKVVKYKNTTRGDMRITQRAVK